MENLEKLVVHCNVYHHFGESSIQDSFEDKFERIRSFENSFVVNSSIRDSVFDTNEWIEENEDDEDHCNSDDEDHCNSYNDDNSGNSKTIAMVVESDENHCSDDDSKTTQNTSKTQTDLVKNENLMKGKRGKRSTTENYCDATSNKKSEATSIKDHCNEAKKAVDETFKIPKIPVWWRLNNYYRIKRSPVKATLNQNVFFDGENMKKIQAARIETSNGASLNNVKVTLMNTDVYLQHMREAVEKQKKL